MKNDFIDATVILPARNVRETAAFYKDKLGFEINGIWENPAYGSVKRGNVVIEFGEARINDAGSGVCYIHVDDAEPIYNEFKSKDVEFVGDFAVRDYGSRDFRIKDNNGNMLIIGSPLKNKHAILQYGNIA